MQHVVPATRPLRSVHRTALAEPLAGLYVCPPSHGGAAGSSRINRLWRQAYPARLSLHALTTGVCSSGCDVRHQQRERQPLTVRALSYAELNEPDVGNAEYGK